MRKSGLGEDRVRIWCLILTTGGSPMSGLAPVKLLAVGIMERWTDLEGTSAEFTDGSHVGIEGERRVKGRGVGMPLTEWNKFGVGELYFYYFFFIFIFLVPALLRCN